MSFFRCARQHQRFLDKRLAFYLDFGWVIFRSPWSNQYEPALDDGAMPSERLRKLEIDANTAFDQYREMYFEGGVSSVYLWDLDHGFAGKLNSERQLKIIDHLQELFLSKRLVTGTQRRSRAAGTRSM